MEEKGIRKAPRRSGLADAIVALVTLIAWAVGSAYIGLFVRVGWEIGAAVAGAFL